MRLQSKLGGTVYQFDSVKEVLGRANEKKSGDEMAGIAARSDSERIAAKDVLSDLLISDIRENPVVPYEEDEVTRIIQDAIDEQVYARIRNWSIAELRAFLLSEKTQQADIEWLRKGLTSETVAAVAKLMSNLDLVYAANKIRVHTTCNTTMGLRGTLSSRLQPSAQRSPITPRTVAARMELVPRPEPFGIAARVEISMPPPMRRESCSRSVGAASAAKRGSKPARRSAARGMEKGPSSDEAQSCS